MFTHPLRLNPFVYLIIPVLTDMSYGLYNKSKMSPSLILALSNY